MKNKVFFIVLLCMQQIVHGAAAVSGPVVDSESPEEQLQALSADWQRIHLQVHMKQRPISKKRFSFERVFSLPLGQKKKSKPTYNELLLLQIACEYKRLRNEFPQLPENEAIQFFIDNSTVNGPIEDFRFNDPYSAGTVTRESDGAYHAAVTWPNHPDYAQVERDSENGSITVVYPKISRRGRSNTSPAPVEPKSLLVGQSRRPNRAERGLSLPANPAAHEFFQELPKAESGYGSGQSVAPKALAFSQKAGATFFAEV